MANQTTGMIRAPAVVVHPTESGFPPQDLPTIFADGVVNVAPSPQVVKFYFFRTDPNTSGDGADYKNQVCGQIVMATQSFAQTCVFFERSLRLMIASGLVSQEYINELNAIFDANAAEPVKQ